MENISVFKNFTKDIGTRILSEIVQGIRRKHYKEVVYRIRKAAENKDQELADQLKKSLLGFTVSGAFSGGRRMEFLQKYNPFVILDIGKLDVALLDSVVEKINQISFTRMSFISPSGRGVKIIVKVDSGVDQHWLAYKQVAEFYESALGVVIDKSGKDVTRLCFMSHDPAAYFNPGSEVFKVLNAEPFIQSISLEVKQEVDPVISTQTPIEVVEIPDGFDNAFANCVAQTEEKLVFEKGNRNNYIYQLAVNCNLAGIPFEVTNAMCKATYDLANEETERTVRSAYNWKPRSPNFENSFSLPVDTPPPIPLKVFSKLPNLLREGCATFKDERERDVFLTGALGVLSGCLPNVSGVYDGHVSYPNLYVFIIAPSASGKGALKFAKTLGAAYHEQLLEESRQAQEEHRRALFSFELATAQYKKGKTKEPPTEPKEEGFKTLFIPANSSSAMLVRHLNQNNDSGILFESEADTLGNVLKQDWGGYSDLMRKAYHHESISYSRKYNNEFVEIAHPRLSVALSGTPNQVTSLIPSAEDGLFSRFMFYAFQVDADWRDVSPGGRGQNFQSFYQRLSKDVLGMVNFLKLHPMEFDLKKEQWKVLNDVFKGLMEETNSLVGKDALSIVKRLGLMLFRIAMTLSAIRKCEEQTVSKSMLCEDEDFEVALWLVETYLEHSLFLYDRLPKWSKSSFQFKNVRQQKFYDKLPLAFSKREAVKIGADLQIPERTVGRYLNVLMNSGYLVPYPEKQHGMYKKKQ